MTKQEFEKLTGVRISDKYFTQVINPAYMESDKEKIEFCAGWKRKGGVKKALQYEIERAQELEATVRECERRISSFKIMAWY